MWQEACFFFAFRYVALFPALCIHEPLNPKPCTPETLHEVNRCRALSSELLAAPRVFNSGEPKPRYTYTEPRLLVMNNVGFRERGFEHPVRERERERGFRVWGFGFRVEGWGFRDSCRTLSPQP